MGVGFEQTVVAGEGQRVLLTQDVTGVLQPRIGMRGLDAGHVRASLARLEAAMAALRSAIAGGSFPHATILSRDDDIAEAETALARLSAGARTIVFLGTGGSSLGGQTLAQLSGWNIPGASDQSQKGRPRTRFYDNLDASTFHGALTKLDLASTRFVITSKSGGTSETLVQAIAALDAVRCAGLADLIPQLFLAVSDPPAPGRTNGLRDLAAACGLPVLEHPPSIGGRYAALSIVGLLPAMARGSDARLLRAGARAVIEPLIAGLAANAYAPAVGAAVATTLAIERGVRVNVMMPYNDRLHRFGAWYAQLWAESLGKGGQGTTPLACLGPLDQHSQLQLFMDGAPEHYLTVVRAVEATTSPPMPHDLARLAGIDFMGGRTIDALVAAQAEAVSDALMQAGRPVRTITLDRLDEASLGALMMHMMLETILSAHLLGVDPFDQPAVELAKQLTRRRLSPQD